MRKGKNTDENKKKKFGLFKKGKNNKEVNKTANENKKEKGSKKKRAIGWKIFRVLLFVGIALCIVGAGVVVGIISSIIDETSSVNLDELANQSVTSYVYNKNGEAIASLYDENRVMIKYDDLPKSLVDAVISIEDERFFSHKGVDVKRTVAAIGKFIITGGNSDFGGSTITQQLVKNITKDKKSDWQRKIREWYRAYTLEKKMNKYDILTAYLNTIYLGDGTYGVAVASKNYFNKELSQINIAESAILAAIIQSPESTNPYSSDAAKEKLLSRQKIVLAKMLELKKITQSEYDEAINFEVAFSKGEDNSNINSYYVDSVIEAVINDLMEQKGIERGVAEKMLYNDGLKIYTPQDPKVQSAIDKAYNNSNYFYTDNDGKFMQSAMVVIEQATGDVVGLIGGAGEKTVNRGINRATSNTFLNQPGSCMKPIGAYGPAIEQGLIGPGTGLDDSELVIGSWKPGNYYRYFYGYVTVRDAIKKSMNIPAIRANLMVDINYAYNFAKNCGLKNLVEADKTASSLAIGGATNGFTVLEMASAYATIANKGVHIEPKLYTKVTDRNGNEILTVKTIANKAMEESTAYMLTSCLQSVVTSGTAAGYVRVGNMPIAGKTGNTDDDYDQWFCGYSPYYTIACWNGYDKNQTIGYRKYLRSYPYTCIPLFNTVMNEISQGQAVVQFQRPSNVITASVCSVSGLVATDACRNDPRGDKTITDYFASGKVPTATCNIHKMVTVCKNTGLLTNEYCIEKEERSFISRDYIPGVKPKDWQYMVPTETCTTCTKPIEEEPEEPEKPEKPENPDDNVDIYNSGGSSNENHTDSNTDESSNT